MKRLAIFVEGKTEKLFVKRLVREIATRKHLAVEERDYEGGTKFARGYSEVRARITAETQYYVLIGNSNNEDKVKADIIDEYSNLCEKNYEAIIGIRDVYPTDPQFIPQMRSALHIGFPPPLLPNPSTGVIPAPIPIQMILAVMECEAWFIAEHSHFERVHNTLTIDTINAALGMDLLNTDSESIAHPAGTLHRIYELAGLKWLTPDQKKSGPYIERTVNALDYASIYMECGNRCPGIRELVTGLDRFFA